LAKKPWVFLPPGGHFGNPPPQTNRFKRSPDLLLYQFGSSPRRNPWKTAGPESFSTVDDANNDLHSSSPGKSYVKETPRPPWSGKSVSPHFLPFLPKSGPNYQTFALVFFFAQPPRPNYFTFPRPPCSWCPIPIFSFPTSTPLRQAVGFGHGFQRSRRPPRGACPRGHAPCPVEGNSFSRFLKRGTGKSWAPLSGFECPENVGSRGAWGPKAGRKNSRMTETRPFSFPRICRLLLAPVFPPRVTPPVWYPARAGWRRPRKFLAQQLLATGRGA